MWLLAGCVDVHAMLNSHLKQRQRVSYPVEAPANCSVRDDLRAEHHIMQQRLPSAWLHEQPVTQGVVVLAAVEQKAKQPHAGPPSQHRDFVHDQPRNSGGDVEPRLHSLDGHCYASMRVTRSTLARSIGESSASAQRKGRSNALLLVERLVQPLRKRAKQLTMRTLGIQLVRAAFERRREDGTHPEIQRP